MEFTIQTDHKPVEGLLNEKKGVPQQAAPGVQRWALTLAAYEYKIAYKAGETNANADALSRLPLPKMPESVSVPGETILLLEHLDHIPSTLATSKNGQDAILSYQEYTSSHSTDGLPIVLTQNCIHI